MTQSLKLAIINFFLLLDIDYFYCLHYVSLVARNDKKHTQKKPSFGHGWTNADLISYST